MLKDTTVLEELAIKNYINNYEKDTIDVKNKSINYLANNNEKDFSDINYALKRMEYNQIIFPKKIRKENALQEIRKASSSLYKINKKLSAINLIEKEIIMNKTSGGISQTTKKFETFIKIRKQSLIAKSNKILFGLYSIQLPSSFNDKTNNIPLQKITKKFNQKIDRLTKELENEIRIIASNGTDNKVDTMRKINRLKNNLDKLQFVLDILPNYKEQIKNKNFNQSINNASVIVTELEKDQKLLDDVDSSNNALKLLKQGNPENSIDIVNKINKDLNNKQKQFLDLCKNLLEITKPAL